MVIQKYNRGNGKYTIGSAASINSQKSNSSTTTTSGGGDCDLWGNHFDGMTDLEDTLFTRGSLYAMPSIFEGIEDDEEDDLPEGELPEYKEKEYPKIEGDEGGNVYAENLIKSFGDLDVDGKGSLKAAEYKSGYSLPDEDDSSKFASTEWVNRKISAHKTLTVNDSTGANLGSFDNTSDETITIKNYDSEISGLDSRISTNTANITALAESTNTSITNIEGNVGKLLKAKSVIIATVELIRTGSDSAYTFNSYGSYYDGVSFNKILVGEGTIDLYLNLDSSKINTINSIYANATIGSTLSNSDSDDDIRNGNSNSYNVDGAYGGMWSHTRAVLSTDRKTLIVRCRVWHKDKDDNESVGSNKGWTVNAIRTLSFFVAGEPS